MDISNHRVAKNISTMQARYQRIFAKNQRMCKNLQETQMKFYVKYLKSLSVITSLINYPGFDMAPKEKLFKHGFETD